MARFEVKKKDGSWSPQKTLDETSAIARDRLVPGDGHFTVVRVQIDEGKYPHPDLGRGEALDVVDAMLHRIGTDARIVVRDREGVEVFRARRVLPDPVYLNLNPLRDCVGLRGLRIDQGVDYSVTAESPVYAIGTGIVTIYRPVSGWPLDPTHPDGGAYIAYKLTAGPQSGLYVYDAERITLNPALKVGSVVGPKVVVATHRPGFANCEMGWASAETNGYSPEAAGYYRQGMRTVAGESFDQLMQNLGAPPGLTEGRVISGTLPGKYPPP